MAADGRIEIRIKADDKDLRKAEGSVKKFTASILLAKGAETAFRAIANSLDMAISRFDTLNQFPRTLEAVGFGAEESERAIEKLSDGIQGLPTRLDEVADTAKRLAMMTKDIDLATDLTLALNDAFLANGATSADAARGLEQYIQMLGNGTVDMQSWRSLTETMGTSLGALAEEMGFTGASATQDLYKALKDGVVTFDEFNAKLIEMDKEVGGFAERALIGSEGIATSWQNIKTAIATGTERVIRAFDDVAKSITGNNIAQNMDFIKFAIADAFKAIADSVVALTPLFEAFFTVAGKTVSILKTLSPVLIGLAAAYAALLIIQKVNSIIDANALALQLAAFSGKALTIAIGAKTAATTADTAATVASTGAITISQAVIGILTGQIKLATVATGAWTTATTIFTGVIAAIGWPILIVVAAIGALVAIGVGMYKWLMRTTPEVENMATAMSEANEETDNLTNSTGENARAYEKRQEAIESQSATMKNLADETYALSQQEELNAAQKKVLQENVDELNDSVDNLNLSYNEETGMLSQTAEAMYERVEAMEAQEAMIESQERLQEITREQNEIDEQMQVNTKLLNEAQEKRDELTWNEIGSKKALDEEIEKLTESNSELEVSLQELGITQEIVSNEQMEYAERVAEAEEASKNRRVTSYHELNEAQREAYDAMNERTLEIENQTINSWDKIEKDTSLSMEIMKENLLHNIEAMDEWQENMNILAERGVSEGMLLELGKMGPEGALLVEQFVNSSDEELAEFEEVYGRAGTNAKDRMLEEIDMSQEDLTPGMYELFGTAENAWHEAVETSSISKTIPEEIEKGRDDAVSAGQSVAEGVAEGVQAGTESVITSGTNMATGLNDGFAGELGIQSPSTKFIQHGVDIIAGLVSGVSTNQSKVVQVMQNLGQAMNKAMATEITNLNLGTAKSFAEFSQTLNKLSSDTKRTMNQISKTIYTETQNITRGTRDFSLSLTRIWTTLLKGMESSTGRGFRAVANTIAIELRSAEASAARSSANIVSHLRSGVSGAQSAGYQMGIGFRNGLASTERSIMNTATRIANSAAQAITRALDIHSPSRLTFGLGKNTGEGFVNGMKSMINDVVRTGTKLAESAVPKVNTMASFGELAYAGSTAMNSTSTKNTAIHIDTINNYTDGDIEEVLKQAAWVIDRERGRLDG